MTPLTPAVFHVLLALAGGDRHGYGIIGGTSVLVALTLWAATFCVAAYEWPNGPTTSWFLWQIGIALTAGSVLTQSVLRINR